MTLTFGILIEKVKVIFCQLSFSFAIGVGYFAPADKNYLGDRNKFLIR